MKEVNVFYRMDNRLYENETNVSVYAHKLYYILRMLERAHSNDVMTNLDFLCTIANFVDSHITKNRSRVVKCIEELTEKGFIEEIIGDYNKASDIFVIKLEFLDDKGGRHAQIKPSIMGRIDKISDINIKKYEITSKDKLIMFKFICFIMKWKNSHTFIPSIKDYCNCLDITEEKFYNINEVMINLGLIEKNHGGWFEDSVTPKRKPNKYKYTEENIDKYKIKE